MIILAAGGLAYANTFHNPFVFDDHQAIVGNQHIRDLSHLGAVLNPERELPTAGRPLVNLTFAINYAIGGLDVTGYHAWNLATHLMCALLLFAILRRTFAKQTGWLGEAAVPLACAAALVWAVHPLNTDAVDYVTQRTELTMALLLLLTLYASLRALEAPRRSSWITAAILACGLGMASKESMVTAPVLVAIYDRVFVFKSFREAWASRKGLYIGLASTWLVLAALMWNGPRRNTAGFSTDVSPVMYLLNQFPMIARYLWLALVPHGLVQNYGWPQAVTLASVLPWAVVVLSLLLATILAFGRWPKLAFLGAWVWITLAPTSSIVPIATEVGAERRMYLALMAVVTLGILAIARASEGLGWPARAGALALVTLTLAVLTFARNLDYASPVRIAETTISRYPTPVGRHVLATELLAVGRRQEAMTQLRLAVPGAPRAHYTLGVELLDEGQLDAGIAELQAFIAAEPYMDLALSAHEYLGKAHAQRQEWPQAIAEFRAMLKIAPDNPPAERLLADACFNARDMTSAVGEYELYIKTQSSDVDALNQLGIALASSGRLAEAVDILLRAVKVNPQDGPVERNLSLVLYKQHDIERALVHAERAVALQPDDEGSRELLRTLRLAR